MGAGASLLHEDDYRHFLELGPVVQQEWLRRIPRKEMPELQERTHDLPAAVRINLLALVRETSSRSGGPRLVPESPPPEILGMDHGPSAGLVLEASRPFVEKPFVPDNEADRLALEIADGNLTQPCQQHHHKHMVTSKQPVIIRFVCG